MENLMKKENVTEHNRKGWRKRIHVVYPDRLGHKAQLGLVWFFHNLTAAPCFVFIVNSCDFDHDPSSDMVFMIRHFMQLVFSAENSGRVLKYNPNTKETTVLVRNIQFPNGVSLSKDGSFFVFCEGAPGR